MRAGSQPYNGRAVSPGCWLLARVTPQLPQVVERHCARDDEGLPRLQPIHCITYTPGLELATCLRFWGFGSNFGLRD